MYVFSFCLCGLSAFRSSRSDVVGPFYLLPPQCTASPAYYYYILFIYLAMSVGGWVSATTPWHMCEDRRTDLGNWFSPSEHVLGNKLRLAGLSALSWPGHTYHRRSPAEKLLLASRRWCSYCHSSEYLPPSRLPQDTLLRHRASQASTHFT